MLPLSALKYDFDTSRSQVHVELSLPEPLRGVNQTTFSARFHANTRVHTPDARIYFHDEQGVHEVEPVHRVYTGADGTLALNSDGSLHLLLHTPSFTIAVDPMSDADTGHGAYLLHEQLRDLPKSRYAIPEGRPAFDVEDDFAEPGARQLLSLDRWDDCYEDAGEQQPRRALVGMAIDYGTYQERNNLVDMQVEIDRWIANTNVFYEQQLGVQLVINKYEIYSTPGGPSWNFGAVGNPRGDDCSHLSLDSRLRTFVQWVDENSSGHTREETLWHFVTNCYTISDSTGYAWLDALCLDGGWNSGMTKYFDLTWVTLAHEIGHNFGAQHTFENGASTTGGIMDYGDGRHSGWHSFNTQYRKEEICAEVRRAIPRRQGQCLPRGWVNEPQPVNAQCADHRAYCAAMNKEELRFKCANRYVENDCPLACERCDPTGRDIVEPADIWWCEDRWRNCEYWAGIGECQANPLWMLDNCKVSCRVCDPETRPPVNEPDVDCRTAAWSAWSPCSRPCNGGHRSRVRDIVQLPKGNGADCQDLVESEECNPGPCEYDDPALCWDNPSYSGSCAGWAAIGECEANPSWMRENCRRSCELCVVV